MRGLESSRMYLPCFFWLFRLSVPSGLMWQLDVYSIYYRCL